VDVLLLGQMRLQLRATGFGSGMVGAPASGTTTVATRRDVHDVHADLLASRSAMLVSSTRELPQST
jgi:hypothetical protein